MINMEKVYRIQREMQKKFRDVPPEGVLVDYLDKKFRVYHTVFWPSWDSMALVKNYRINPGERCLDLCTGSGVIAIFSALKGATRVVATDINPQAIRCVIENSKAHRVSAIVDARISDMFSSIEANERFDVITMNPPFTPHHAADYAEKTVWDAGLHVHRAFFAGAGRHLKEDGRIYLCQASFGARGKMLEFASAAGFESRVIGKTEVDGNRTFYAFELRRA